MPDDFSGSPLNAAGVLPVGSTIRAVFETPGDRDAFALTLEAGQVYTVWINTDAGDLEAADQPRLYGIQTRAATLPM